MATVGKLKQVRNAHRTNLKRLDGNIKTILETKPVDLVKLKGVAISLSKKVQSIQKLDDEILEKTVEEEEINKGGEDSSIFDEYVSELFKALINQGIKGVFVVQGS